MAATLSFPEHKISTHASLVFQNLLNVSTWPQWSRSIVDADTTFRDPSPVSEPGDLPAAGPWLAHSHKKTIKSYLPSVLRSGAELTVWTTENPRRPGDITTSKINVLRIAKPTSGDQGDETISPGHDKLEQAHCLGDPSLSPVSEASSTSAYRTNLATPGAKDARYPDSFVVSYHVTSATQPDLRSRPGKRAFLSSLASHRRTQHQSYDCTHIILPLGPSACLFNTVVRFSAGLRTSDVSRSSFSRPSWPWRGPQCPTSTTALSSDSVLFYIRDMARELGGYCVRFQLEQDALDRIACSHRQEEEHDTDAMVSDFFDRSFYKSERLAVSTTTDSTSFGSPGPYDYRRKSSLGEFEDDDIFMALEAQLDE